MHSRLARILLIATAAVALAAAGIAVNFVLLRYADSRDDPVGKLRPRATLTQPTSPAAKPPTNDSDDEADHEEPDD